jgi:hypothetical protein
VPLGLKLDLNCFSLQRLKLHFTSADKDRLGDVLPHAQVQAARRRAGMGHGIEIGRGGFWIELNEEKYQVPRRA